MIKKNFNFDTNSILNLAMNKAVEIQKRAVREQYPHLTDFDITYDSFSKKFRYTGLTREQIKTLPGVTEK